MTGLTKTTQITTVTYSYKPPPVTNHKQNKCTVDSSKRQRGHVHGPSEAPVRQTGRVPHNKHCHACCSSYSCQKHQNMAQYHTTNTSSCSCQKHHQNMAQYHTMNTAMSAVLVIPVKKHHYNMNTQQTLPVIHVKNIITT